MTIEIVSILYFDAGETWLRDSGRGLKCRSMKKKYIYIIQIYIGFVLYKVNALLVS